MSPASPPHLPFRLRLRVYWEDTDAGGVVFYANYLKFFERARTEWLRACGIEQEAMRRATNHVFVVTDTNVHYKAPARLDDEIDVTVAVESARPASMRFAQQAWRGNQLLAVGSIRVGCVDAGTFRPQRIPDTVIAALGPQLPPAEPRLQQPLAPTAARAPSPATKAIAAP